MASDILVNSSYGVSPVSYQTIAFDGLSSFGPSETHYNEMLFDMQSFWLKKMSLKMPSEN